MATDKEVLDIVAPELIDSPDINKDFFLGQAHSTICQNIFRDQYQFAVALKAAHWLTISIRGGPGGPITSEKEGDLSRNFGIIKSDNLLSTTSHGLKFLEISKMFVIPFTINCNCEDSGGC